MGQQVHPGLGNLFLFKLLENWVDIIRWQEESHHLSPEMEHEPLQEVGPLQVQALDLLENCLIPMKQAALHPDSGKVCVGHIPHCKISHLKHIYQHTK